MNWNIATATDDGSAPSLFYPACGTDLGPVLMTADTVQEFVYTDWYESEENVIRAFSRPPCDNLRLLTSFPVHPEQYGRACLRTVCRNPRSDHYLQPVLGDEFAQELQNLFPPSFTLTPQELVAYDQRRRAANGVLRPWAREFVFIYTGGGEPRKLKLLYFSDEGLARYCVFYHRRHQAPQFVCTIQSGPGYGFGWASLEQPGGTFERLMLACNPRPVVWIRSVWPGEPQIGYWNRPLPEFAGGNVQAFVHEDRIP